MYLTRKAISKSRVTFIFLLIIIAGGIYSYFSLPRSYDPGFILRVARVVTYFPGASPERVEQLVTDQLEKVIMEMPELNYVESSSMAGVSLINVWVKGEYTDLRPIWDKLRRKVEKAERNLPDEAAAPIVNDEYGDIFGVTIAVIGDDFSFKELKDAGEKLRDELLDMENVAKVELYGDQDEKIYINYSNSRLSQLGITPYYLMNLLGTRNILIPGGSINVGTERVVLEPSGNFIQIEDLKKTVIPIPKSGETIFLEDIAEIKRGYIDPPMNLMRANGKRAVGVSLSMKEGGNIIQLGESVKNLLKEVESEFPYGISFELVNFSPKEVQDKVLLFQENLLQSVLIVLCATLVMLGFKTGFVVASLIPSAILMTFFGMKFFNIGIDQMSLASLVIALGILVDNAIVVTESVQVDIYKGKRPIQAAVNSAKELSVPLLTSSATTAAAFLPIYLAESETGEYTAPLFKVVSIALFSSWILSLTMIPLLCIIFIKKGKSKKNSKFKSLVIIFRVLYRKMLFISLRYRYVFIVIVFVMFFLSMKLFSRLPVLFFPPSDRLIFKVEMRLAPGTSISTTENMVKLVEGYILENLMYENKKDREIISEKLESPADSSVFGEKKFKGIINFVTHLGNGGPRFLITHKTEVGQPHYSLMVINVAQLSDISLISEKLEEFILSNFPDVDLKIKRIQNGPPISDPVQIRLSGKDSERLFEMVNSVKKKLGEIKAVRNITDDWGERTKKIIVEVDYLKARRAGVSSKDVAVSLYTAVSGFQMTDFREDDKIIPILLKSDENKEKLIDRLESLAVYSSATGQNVLLGQVCDLRYAWEASEIKRRDRKKTVTVSSGLEKGYTANEVMKLMEPWLQLKDIEWGLGYKYVFGGEVEESIDANKSIMDKLPVCGFIILMILIIQFNSVRKTIIILSTIPMATMGVAAGLYIMNSYFGFMTLLGIVALAGIVINNAIVLLERIKVEIDNGHSSQLAVIYACERRMRPILLTTITTIMGVLPLYFGGGAIWEPMVVSIIAGLGFSTILTLGVVPMLYCALFRVRFRGDELEQMKDLEQEFD
ncbi:MAG: efflux RND transporter permease subunit [Desulforegulaceae bacterium]|nr:efflux RND transporter permease subunit [Desulforegulaceae bacterium]